ncbi:MAG: hypothetical protein RIQ59_724 [Bacteroidota bacterium]|jgi:hypothetical protein
MGRFYNKNTKKITGITLAIIIIALMILKFVFEQYHKHN